MDIVAQNVGKLKAAFGDRAFSGRDVSDVLEVDARGTGGIFKYMLARSLIRRVKTGAYQFISQAAPAEAPVKADAPASTPAPVITSELVCSPPSVVRIGDFLLHDRAMVLADTRKIEGLDAIRLVTTILEYDTTFRAVRNKVLTFSKKEDPREYAAMRAWLDSLAGKAPTVDDTALELAAELESKLNAANREIAELKAKIDAIRGMFRGEL